MRKVDVAVVAAELLVRPFANEYDCHPVPQLLCSCERWHTCGIESRSILVVDDCWQRVQERVAVDDNFLVIRSQEIRHREGVAAVRFVHCISVSESKCLYTLLGHPNCFRRNDAGIEPAREHHSQWDLSD